MMSDNTLTMMLEGDVRLEQFTRSLHHLHNLVGMLTREVADNTKIEWFIEALQGGSALATIAGVAEEESAVYRVIEAVNTVGQALQDQKVIPFSAAVAHEALALTGVVTDDVTEMRLMTANGDSVIYGQFKESLQSVGQRQSFGQVKGRVQAISNRGNLKFTLYDTVFDKPVTCFLQKGQEEQLRHIWGNEIIVSGRVTRGAQDGQPKSVRDITGIYPLVEYLPGSYKQAQGVFAWQEGDEPAEDSIKRVRDAQH